ncbi:Type IV secretion system protein VirB11 [compost metagenome]
MTTQARSLKMLRTAFGPALLAALSDPDVVEVMLNPDGRIWLDRLTGGLELTQQRLEPAEGERVVRLVAHHVGLEVDETRPRISAELPETGERFEGLLPPIVRAPAFAIRKPAVAVFTLDDYVAAGVMDAGQAQSLRDAVAQRRNILVVGGTSSGKTTLVNALLAEMAGSDDRIILIEDIRELQCAAPNTVALRTRDGAVTLTDLVRSALRLRPDRIPIGEVRGAEALDLVKAWGTGHPGGVGTLHAGSARGALNRLEQLIQEAVLVPPRALIAETIHLVAVRPVEAPRDGWSNSPPSMASTPTAGIACRPSPPDPSDFISLEHRHDRLSTPPPSGRLARAGRRLRFARPGRRLLHALGGAASVHPAVDRGARGQDHCGDDHHRHRLDPGLR